MKKLIPLLLVLAMLVGCGSSAAGSAASAVSQEAFAASDEAVPAEVQAAEAEPEEPEAAETASAAEAAADEGDGTWAIYMYVCGSDLESKHGSATANIEALRDAARTSDTIFLMEAGGTTEWQNEYIEPTQIERWLYTDEGMSCVDMEEQADMGESATLQDFLEYATTNYPADHTMVLLWDHGGGTIGGCCCDDNYQDEEGHDDYLTLNEVHEAFANVFDLSEENPPVDIVGFDCCLMATIDVADMLKDTAQYLVASEETEPAYGWDYNSIGAALGENPTMDAVELGTLICDSYYSRLVELDQAATATLSLVDLSEITPLTEAFSAYADEMLVNAYNDPEFFRDYTAYAKDSEHYGSATRGYTYTDMTDIQDFVQICSAEADIDCGDPVLAALQDCVLYQVQGEYRAKGGGLSFYFDYDGYYRSNDAYRENGVIEALKALYSYGVSNQVDEDESAYMAGLGLDAEELPEVMTFLDYDIDEVPVQYNEYGVAYADFGTAVSTCITDAWYNMYALIDDVSCQIGTDNEIGGEPEQGLVYDNSGENWGYFDGNLCYMQLDYTCDAYNIYSVPVLYEGQQWYLQVVYDYGDGTWNVTGATLSSSSEVFDDRVFDVYDGEEYTLLYYDMDGNAVEGPTFTYSEDCFEYKAMEDGRYGVKFVIGDMYDNWIASDLAVYTLQDGIRYYDDLQ